MNHYETVFILTPVLSDVQAKEAVEKFKDIITAAPTKIQANFFIIVCILLLPLLPVSEPLIQALQGFHQSFHLIPAQLPSHTFYHGFVESGVMLIHASAFFRKRDIDNSSVLAASLSDDVAFLDQAVHRYGEGSDGDGEFARNGAHIFGLTNTDGLNHMDIIACDILEPILQNRLLLNVYDIPKQPY